jgi:hypothetical protein
MRNGTVDEPTINLRVALVLAARMEEVLAKREIKIS